jgi:hypothetical protein
MAVVFLIEVAALDLVQALNSTDDLYAAATTGLNSYQLNDDVHDFRVYFCLNLGVALVAVLVACLPGRDAKNDEVGSD